MCSKRKYSKKIELLKKVGEIFCSKNYMKFFVNKKKICSPPNPVEKGPNPLNTSHWGEKILKHVTNTELRTIASSCTFMITDMYMRAFFLYLGYQNISKSGWIEVWWKFVVNPGRRSPNLSHSTWWRGVKNSEGGILGGGGQKAWGYFVTALCASSLSVDLA